MWATRLFIRFDQIKVKCVRVKVDRKHAGEIDTKQCRCSGRNFFRSLQQFGDWMVQSTNCVKGPCALCSIGPFED